MPSMPLIRGYQLIKVLIAKGFVLNRVNGSHHILVHKEHRLTVSVPVHKGKTLGRGITLSIIKDAGLTPQELFQLLQKRH